MIKKIFSLSVIAVIVLLFIFSCDKVEHPYINVSSSNQVSDSSCVFPVSNPNVYRKIFLEDYTGHLCGTCPPAAVALYETWGLKQTYGDTLISIGVHSTLTVTYNAPCPPHPY